jgi:hypothetical protein
MGYAAGYKKDIDLELLDPPGAVVQKWRLEGAFITSANFGSLDYNSSDIADIAVTLRPDRCILVY